MTTPNRPMTHAPEVSTASPSVLGMGGYVLSVGRNQMDRNRTMTDCEDILINTLTKKYWHNVGQYCDRKHHVFFAEYRRYKRGKNRCIECGYKIGKRILERYSYSEKIVDDIYKKNPILEYLKARGRIK